MSDAKKLAMLLIGVLARTKMKRDPFTGNYEYTMYDKLVMTEEVHDIMQSLLAKHGD